MKALQHAYDDLSVEPIQEFKRIKVARINEINCKRCLKLHATSSELENVDNAANNERKATAQILIVSLF